MKYAFGNWKANLDYAAALAAARALAGALPLQGVEMAVFPEATHLRVVADALRGATVRVGAQSVAPAPGYAAATGFVPAPELKPLAKYALIGHSEQRAAGVNDAAIAAMVAAAHESSLVPVLCVGESLALREADKAVATVLSQLEAASSHEPHQPLIVAYEPVWAIGTGKTPTAADAGQVVKAIRTWAAGRGIQSMPVLYGGSVDADNARRWIETGFDGILAGRASQTAAGFVELAQAIV